MNENNQQLLLDMKLVRKNVTNKIVLGSFLVLVVLTLFMRLLVGILLDMGLVEGHFHVGFWSNPEKAFEREFDEFKLNHHGATWDQFMEYNHQVHAMIEHHPNMIWFTTQFTWLTTIIIVMYVTFRFFKFDDTVPRWLRWIMTQRTLSLVAMYDTVVGVVFWAAMFRGFSEAFSGTLKGAELTITISVHAIIPLFILTYSILFLIQDKKASQLHELFALKGLIYPAVYMVYYVIITIVWYDPYPVTTMHHELTKNQEVGGQPDWNGWAKQLYLAPLALLVIYIILGMMTLVHNIILHKCNKHYDPEHDYDIIKRKEHKLDKIARKLIRQEARNWKNLKGN